MSRDMVGWGTRPQPPAGTAVVTQAELAELVWLDAHVRRHRDLVRRLKGLLAAGAGVESGRLTAAVTPVRQRRLTRAVLTALLGAARVEQLQAAAPPTTYHRLDVREAAPAPTEVTPRRRPRAGPGGFGEPLV